MNYCGITAPDIANGTGVRTSLFVSGCTHKCKGCFNSEAWDFNYGEPFTEEVEDKIIEELKPDYINGLTLLGGEPFEPQNQEGLIHLLRRVKNELPEKNIWCYTGYVLDDDILKGKRKYTEYTHRMLSCIDVLVDGPFVESLRNLMLEFRGSENQRLLNLKEYLAKLNYEI